MWVPLATSGKLSTSRSHADEIKSPAPFTPESEVIIELQCNCFKNAFFISQQVFHINNCGIMQQTLNLRQQKVSSQTTVSFNVQILFIRGKVLFMKILLYENHKMFLTQINSECNKHNSYCVS